MKEIFYMKEIFLMDVIAVTLETLSIIIVLLPEKMMNI